MIESIILKKSHFMYNWDPHSWTLLFENDECACPQWKLTSVMRNVRTECQCSSSSKLPSMRASGEGKLARPEKKGSVNALFHHQYHDFYRLPGLTHTSYTFLTFFYPKNWQAAFILILQSIQSSLLWVTSLSNLFYYYYVLNFPFFLKIFSS